MLLFDWLDQLTAVLLHDTPRFVLIAGLITTFGVFETVWPAHVGQRWSGKARNIVYIATFFLLGLSFMSLLSLWIHPSIPAWRVTGVWTGVLLVVSLFFSDVLFYWYHRFLHKLDWLWPIHELHHADTELNATSSLRTYWFELPVQAVFIALPTRLIFGAHPELQIAVMALTTTLLFFTHANLRLHLGPLSPVIMGPQTHRIHHAIASKYQDKNFAQFFPIIDMMFGTYYQPARDEFPSTGTESLPVDAPIGSVLIRPLKQWLGR